MARLLRSKHTAASLSGLPNLRYSDFSGITVGRLGRDSFSVFNCLASYPVAANIWKCLKRMFHRVYSTQFQIFIRNLSKIWIRVSISYKRGKIQLVFTCNLNITKWLICTLKPYSHSCNSFKRIIVPCIYITLNQNHLAWIYIIYNSAGEVVEGKAEPRPWSRLQAAAAAWLINVCTGWERDRYPILGGCYRVTHTQPHNQHRKLLFTRRFR